MNICEAMDCCLKMGGIGIRREVKNDRFDKGDFLFPKWDKEHGYPVGTHDQRGMSWAWDSDGKFLTIELCVSSLADKWVVVFPQTN